jgi:hypothetical protein
MLLEFHVPTLRTEIVQEESFGPMPAVSGCGDHDAVSGDDDSICGGNCGGAGTPSGVGRVMGVARLEDLLKRKTFAAPDIEAIAR